MQFAPALGRILFVVPMIIFGFGHLGDAQIMVDNGMVPSFLPAPLILVYLTGILLIVSSISIAVGFKAKQSALVLSLFLASTTFLVWAPMMASVTPDMEQMVFGNFMKDLGLTGAALYMSYFGAGPMSMDSKKAE
jgi:putative oxidoreductase